MEAFSLLKYWRGGGGVTGNNERTIPGITTVATTVQQPAMETDDSNDDEGSFFDLEFAVPDDDDGEGEGENGNNEDEEDDGDSSTGTVDEEREFNFTVSSGSSGDSVDPNLSLSPSDDLFFKGRLVPFEPSSLVFNPSDDTNSKSQFPVSLLKSATKLRVFTLGFKKPKSTTSEKTESNAATEATPNQNQQPQTQQHQQGKFLTVKFKVEEVPIVSLFTRENSSRSSGNKLLKQNSDDTATEDKRFSKDVVQKYLKMIKPLYVKVSRRYGEKLKFSGQLRLGLGKAASAPAPAPKEPVSKTTLVSVSSLKTTKNNPGEAEDTEAQCSVRTQKLGSLPAGLRVVRKHLGKSRSASSAVAAVVPTLPSQASRRDDSLLQQQDGIQGAILHCKRSFNATRDAETSMLSRCASDPSHEKSVSSCRNSSDLSHKKAISSCRISSEEGSNAHARI